MPAGIVLDPGPECAAQLEFCWPHVAPLLSNFRASSEVSTSILPLTTYPRPSWQAPATVPGLPSAPGWNALPSHSHPHSPPLLTPLHPHVRLPFPQPVFAAPLLCCPCAVPLSFVCYDAHAITHQ